MRVRTASCIIRARRKADIYQGERMQFIRSLWRERERERERLERSVRKSYIFINVGKINVEIRFLYKSNNPIFAIEIKMVILLSTRPPSPQLPLTTPATTKTTTTNKQY